MNAPLSRREACRGMVEAFAPWEDEAKKQQRTRLVFLRQLAANRAVSESGLARDAFWLANEIADQWSWARTPAADLKSAADTVVRLFLAGNALASLGGGRDDGI